MVQLQATIDFSDNKIKVQLNQLAREDATPEERFIAQQMEDIFLGIWKMVGEQAELEYSEEKINLPNHGVNPTAQASLFPQG